VIKHRPDPRSKYYLIIKDPITHRRINWSFPGFILFKKALSMLINVPAFI
jgi:hypothetical protein